MERFDLSPYNIIHKQHGLLKFCLSSENNDIQNIRKDKRNNQPDYQLYYQFAGNKHTDQIVYRTNGNNSNGIFKQQKNKGLWASFENNGKKIFDDPGHSYYQSTDDG